MPVPESWNAVPRGSLCVYCIRNHHHLDVAILMSYRFKYTQTANVKDSLELSYIYNFDITFFEHVVPRSRLISMSPLKYVISILDIVKYLSEVLNALSVPTTCKHNVLFNGLLTRIPSAGSRRYRLQQWRTCLATLNA